MSCEDCYKFQKSGLTSFFRWDRANIEIRACEKHLKEVFEVLREAQRNKGCDYLKKEKKDVNRLQ